MTVVLAAPEVTAYRDGERSPAALVWRFEQPMRAIASTAVGGGIGERRWIVNAQVPLEYDRTDLEAHLAAIVVELGCTGPGVGFLTAAAVDGVTSATDDDVAAYATVGLRHPTRAAAVTGDDGAGAAATVGTINVVAGVAARLTDAALVNAVITCTEAKAQALADHAIRATGTASDAVCIVCPGAGTAEQFAGPRSPVGARLARAVHAAVSAGVAAWNRERAS